MCNLSATVNKLSSTTDKLLKKVKRKCRTRFIVTSSTVTVFLLTILAFYKNFSWENEENVYNGKFPVDRIIFIRFDLFHGRNFYFSQFLVKFSSTALVAQFPI